MLWYKKKKKILYRCISYPQVMIDISILVTYYAGSIGIEFESDSYPEWWDTDSEYQIEDEVKKDLLELSPIHEWRTHFETAREYAPPGQTIKPQVGVLNCEENSEEYEYTIEFDSVAELEGF